MCDKHQRKAVRIVSLNDLVSLSLANDLTTSKSIEFAQATLHPIEFRDRTNVEGYGSDAESVSPMNHIAMCFPQIDGRGR